jgi:D-glucosaminate-6-phosphate ammonia-lyase
MRFMEPIQPETQHIRTRLGLRRLVNVAGPITSIGSTSVLPEVIQAMNQIMPENVDIAELQSRASDLIARITGAEAGCITNCTSAGISVAVAAAMTGVDQGRIEQLPDTSGLRNEVLVPAGQLGYFGNAPLRQAISLTGAKVVPVGEYNHFRPYQLKAQINERTAAALYIVTGGTGKMMFFEFAELCHSRKIPVLCDLANVHFFPLFISEGADLILLSAQKFLHGPTAGIIAGQKELVRAAWYQHFGVGRGMKAGKEDIVGAIAALEAWERCNHAENRIRETCILEFWQKSFADLPGVTVTIEPHHADNPVHHLHLRIDAETCCMAAWELAYKLSQGDPAIVTLERWVEKGRVVLDPCYLNPGEEQEVVDRVLEELANSRKSRRKNPMSLAEYKRGEETGFLGWLT